MWKYAHASIVRLYLQGTVHRTYHSNEHLALLSVEQKPNITSIAQRGSMHTKNRSCAV